MWLKDLVVAGWTEIVWGGAGSGGDRPFLIDLRPFLPWLWLE